jgi:hypothetical protein
MAITQSVTCDVCGKQKGEVNHWYLSSVDGGTLHLDKWDDDSAAAAGNHLCGQDCVVKAVNKWMQSA